MPREDRSFGERMQAGELDRGVAGDFRDVSGSGIWLCSGCGEDEFTIPHEDRNGDLCARCERVADA